jgi:hypothetical protein
MNPSGQSRSPVPAPGREYSMAQLARLAVAEDDGRFLLTDGIEQFQDFHQVARGGEPGQGWEDVFHSTLAPGAVRRDVEELSHRLGQLAERIQALERR